jgi:hypothetical protein
MYCLYKTISLDQVTVKFCLCQISQPSLEAQLTRKLTLERKMPPMLMTWGATVQYLHSSWAREAYHRWHVMAPRWDM